MTVFRTAKSGGSAGSKIGVILLTALRSDADACFKGELHGSGYAQHLLIP